MAELVRMRIVPESMASRPQECVMCRYFCSSKEELLEHVVKVHKYENNFLVYCQEDGCGESFTKWEAFKKHHIRKHSHKADKNVVTIYSVFQDHKSRSFLIYYMSNSIVDKHHPFVYSLQMLQKQITWTILSMKVVLMIVVPWMM